MFAFLLIILPVLTLSVPHLHFEVIVKVFEWLNSARHPLEQLFSLSFLGDESLPLESVGSGFITGSFFQGLLEVSGRSGGRVWRPKRGGCELVEVDLLLAPRQLIDPSLDLIMIIFAYFRSFAEKF